MKFFYLAVALLFVVASCFGIRSYSGSSLVFLIFSLNCLLMLAVCFTQKQFYGPIFLSFFFLMGFWFKTVIHFVTGNSFIEPVGSFDFSASSWDQLLITATLGLAGFTLAVFFLRMLAGKREFSESILNGVPVYFEKYRKQIYFLSAAAGIGLAVFNMTWGIHQIGLTPRTILPWPMNALIAFIINLGLMIVFSYYLHWDLRISKGPYWGTLFLFAMAVITSVSSLSRGMFVFQTVPLFFVFVLNRNIKWRQGIFLAASFSICLIVAISLTTIMRNKFYPTSQISPNQELLIRMEVLDGGIAQFKSAGNTDSEALKKMQNEREILTKKFAENRTKMENVPTSQGGDSSRNSTGPIAVSRNEIGFQFRQGAFKSIANLAANRFVGIEGLMAVKSFPGQGWDTFLQALFEKRSLNSPGMYQEVAKSSYRYTDMTAWQFATLPGMIAFLSYSGSGLFVFFGMMTIGALLIFLEIGISILSGGNKILLSLLSCGFANSVAQFGVAPRQDIPHLLMTVASVLFIFFLLKCFQRRVA